jgi:hypothetical protein
MRRGISEADTCALNGWEVGTRLVGDEGFGPTVIKITAIGEEKIMARRISHNGAAVHAQEGMWTLTCREWAEVSR